MGVLFALATSRMFTPLMPPHAFAPVMQVEFIAIHSAVFLGIVAIVRPRTPSEALGRKLAFWGLAAFYALIAVSHGPWVLLGFFAVLFGTNVGLLMTWQTPSAAAQLVARWVVLTPFFLFAAGVAGMPKDVAHWRATDATFVSGTIYFLGIGALEATGFFLRAVPRWAAGVTPGKLGDFGNRFPDSIRQMFAATGRLAEAFMKKMHA